MADTNDAFQLTLSQALGLVEAKREEHVAAVRHFVQTPSISVDGTGIQETADQVRALIAGLGGQAEVVPTAGHPVVYGELFLGKPKTLLIYSMYDVMPVAGEDWRVDPFGGEIVDLPGLGPCIISRGICNSKGPLRGLFNVLETLRQAGQLPVNLKFVIEGEEELGSLHLPAFVSANQERLKSDGVFSPFFSLNRRGRPVVYLGMKGLIKLEVSCRGGDWGGPRSNAIHSMHGAWIASPGWRLVHALVGLVAADETPVAGFREKVSGPTSEEETLLAALRTDFDERVILEEVDAACFKQPSLRGIDLLRNYLFSPAINLDGLSTGHTAEGVKTVIDHQATAKLDIRLVPEMEVDDTIQSVRRELALRGLSDTDIHIVSSYPWSRVSVTEFVVQALLTAYRGLGFQPEIWPFIGGSAPIYLFTRQLGTPLVMGGLAHGGNIHAANEYMVLDHLGLYEKSVTAFLFHFASESLRAEGAG